MQRMYPAFCRTLHCSIFQSREVHMKKTLFTIAAAVSLLAASAHGASLSGLTGSYGCLFNTNPAAFTALKTSNASTNNFVMANSIEIWTFSAAGGGTWAASFNGAVNFNTTNTISASAFPTGTFVETAGPITGSYTETVASTGNIQPVYNVIPTNGGNTLLVQRFATSQTELPMTGVCQKQ